MQKNNLQKNLKKIVPHKMEVSYESKSQEFLQNQKSQQELCEGDIIQQNEKHQNMQINLKNDNVQFIKVFNSQNNTEEVQYTQNNQQLQQQEQLQKQQENIQLFSQESLTYQQQKEQQQKQQLQLQQQFVNQQDIQIPPIIQQQQQQISRRFKSDQLDSDTFNQRRNSTIITKQQEQKIKMKKIHKIILEFITITYFQISGDFLLIGLGIFYLFSFKKYNFIDINLLILVSMFMIVNIFSVIKNFYFLRISNEFKLELNQDSADIHSYKFVAFYEDCKKYSKINIFRRCWHIRNGMIIRKSVLMYVSKHICTFIASILQFSSFIYLLNNMFNSTDDVFQRFFITYLCLQLLEVFIGIISEIIYQILSFYKQIKLYIQKKQREKYYFLDKYKNFNFFELSQEQITNVPECAICLQKYQNKCKVIVLNCGKQQNNHIFHLKCIQNWYSQNKSCPNCRSIIIN